MTVEPFYMYTICLDYSKSKFNLQYFLRTLPNTNYEDLMKSVKEQSDNRLWGIPKKRLGVRMVVSKIRELLISIAKTTTALKLKAKRLTPIDETMHWLSRGGGSQGCSTQSTARPITMAPSQRSVQGMQGTPAQSSDCRSHPIVVSR